MSELYRVPIDVYGVMRAGGRLVAEYCILLSRQEAVSSIVSLVAKVGGELLNLIVQRLGVGYVAVMFVDFSGGRCKPRDLADEIEDLTDVQDVRYVEFRYEPIVFDEFIFPRTIASGSRPVIVLDLKSFEGMKKELEKRWGTAADAVMYHIGYAYGVAFSESVLRDYLHLRIRAITVGEAIEVLAKYWRVMGFGLMRTVEKRFRIVKLAIRDNFEAREVKATVPRCHFTRGVITGFIKSLIQRDISCREEQCQATGAAECLFTVVS